jgi:hypothetical protein
MNRDDKPAGVDIGEVARLVGALEKDLKKVQEGSSDFNALRSEVEQLRALLESPDGDHRQLHQGLHGVRSLLERVETELMDDAFTASQYIVRIGKMLGM